VDIQGQRKKIEFREEKALACLKENLKLAWWANNLRSPLPFKHCLEGMFIEKIEREGLSVRGTNKLDREYSWMKERN
jgi:hypothetical protein